VGFGGNVSELGTISVTKLDPLRGPHPRVIVRVEGHGKLQKIFGSSTDRVHRSCRTNCDYEPVYLTLPMLCGSIIP